MNHQRIIDTGNYAKHVLLAILFIGLSLTLLSQDKKTPTKKHNYNLWFLVFPGHNYRVKIDGVLMPTNNKYKVAKGEHQISIWSPHYNSFDTTIVIDEKKVIIRKKLTPSLYFEEYTRNQRLLSQKSTVMSASALGITASGIATYIFHTRVGKFNLERIKAQSSVDNKSREYNRDSLNEAKNNLAIAKKGRTFFLIASGILTANLIRQILKYRKIKPSTLPDDKSFILDTSVNITPEGNLYPCLTLKF